MRIGMGLGWVGEPIDELCTAVERADRIGIDSVWSLEEYGPDAVTVLGYLAARTERIKLGTGIMQIPARTPAMTAMTALSLDVLSRGRFQLGLGLSVPWLVEGWHGVAYGKPIARSREYVQILRAALAREKVDHTGAQYQVPYRGPGSIGAGKPMHTLITPLRDRLPIYLAAIGPRSVALTGEIADGWLPGLYAPEHQDVLTAPLDEGMRRAGRDPADVDITLILQVARRKTVAEARDFLRPLFAAYLGPVGPLGNPYFDTACRMGHETAAHAVREHYLARRRAEATAAVPDAFIDQVALVGPLEAIVDRIAAWRESRIGTLVPVTQDLQLLEAMLDAAR
ncbi:MAG: LLM class F420-dependent oxidoreductase [Pseudonocardiaceae bacterium]